MVPRGNFLANIRTIGHRTETILYVVDKYYSQCTRVPGTCRVLSSTGYQGICPMLKLRRTQYLFVAKELSEL